MYSHPPKIWAASDAYLRTDQKAGSQKWEPVFFVSPKGIENKKCDTSAGLEGG